MRSLAILTAAAWILFGPPTNAADADVEAARLAEGKQSVEIPAVQMTYQHTRVGARGPLKEGDNETPDIQIFDAYGKFGSGQHGTLMKFPVGFKSILHTHTGDYYAVVIRGVMANYRPNGQVTPLPAGSYWFQRGGEAHVTECLSKEECEAFLVQNVKFDAQLLEKP
jgi:hypothetical protein